MNFAKVDKLLLVFSGLLVVTGLLMLYSVSTVESLERYGSTSYYIRHQIMYGGTLGLLGFLFFFKIPYKNLKTFALPIMIAALVMLVLVKIPGMGFSSGGASRWIHVGPVFFQPAELMKLAVVIYSAAWLSTRRGFGKFWETLGPMFSLLLLAALLILWQPDFGTMIALLLTAFILLVTSGVPWKWILSLAGSGLAVLLILIKLEPYRVARLLTFMDPSRDSQGAGYQILQSLLAVGSGGFWGLGYGLSRQKYNYLPEVIGDSVFAVVAEEMGFIRTVIILVLFLLFFLRGVKVAQAAPDMFGKLLVVGVVGMIMVQVVVNVGATLGVLPLTGIPLPFFSYGSSAFIVNLSALGILFNVSTKANL